MEAIPEIIDQDSLILNIPLRIVVEQRSLGLGLMLSSDKDKKMHFIPIRVNDVTTDFEVHCASYPSVLLSVLLNDINVNIDRIKRITVEMIYTDSTSNITELMVFMREADTSHVSKTSLNDSKESSILDDVGDLISDGLDAVFEVCT